MKLRKPFEERSKTPACRITKERQTVSKKGTKKVRKNPSVITATRRGIRRQVVGIYILERGPRRIRKTRGWKIWQWECDDVI